MKILTFGDSWGAGYGLGNKEKNFTHFLEDLLDAPSQNFSETGSSLGHILHTFILKINRAEKNDLVVVIIPPDVRWYTITKRNEVRTLFIGDREYKNFIRNKSMYWFKYHHSLFIHSIHKICEQLDVKYILAHNYGKLEIINAFKPLIPNNIFLDKNNSLASLLGGDDYKNYSKKHDGPIELAGKNFIPGDNHPNEKGHKIIAELLFNKFNEKYK